MLKKILLVFLAALVFTVPAFAGEGGAYSGFIAHDSEIRKALSALSQDESDLIKNYRIKVELKNMETVRFPGGEGRRVRFNGNFDRSAKRENAVIRIRPADAAWIESKPVSERLRNRGSAEPVFPAERKVLPGCGFSGSIRL